MPDPRFTQEHANLLERLKEWFEREAQKAAQESAPVVEAEETDGNENNPVSNTQVQ